MSSRPDAPNGTQRVLPSARANRRRPLVSTGDAFKLLAGLDDESVDLLVTSPPYWGLRTYGHKHRDELLADWKAEMADPTVAPSWDWYQAHGGVLGLEPYPEWYVAHIAEFFGRARRVLKQTGSMWVNVGDTYFARWSSMRVDGRQGLAENTERARRRTPAGGWRHDKQLLLIPSRVAIAMQEDGWVLRNDLIWRKRNPVPRPETDRLRNAHEHLFHFVKRGVRGNRPTYWYDVDAAESGGIDVVEYGAGRSRDSHSATFPVDLIRTRIESSCPPGGLVLDPFCGTGSSLEAAVASGREAMGFELSTFYAKAARANVARARKESAIDAAGSNGHQVDAARSASSEKKSAAVKATRRSTEV